MDEINMDVNESRKILFEEATADEDFRSSLQSFAEFWLSWNNYNITVLH